LYHGGRGNGTTATQKEQTLNKIDHAFGQLRQMKDGQLEGINAEELFTAFGSCRGGHQR